jgi:hypothetical protein
MLTDEQERISLASCDRVRTAYPVKFLQVMPDPHCVANVQLRIGRSAWRTMHVNDALAFVRLAKRREYRQRSRAAIPAPGVGGAAADTATTIAANRKDTR